MDYGIEPSWKENYYEKPKRRSQWIGFKHKAMYVTQVGGYLSILQEY